MTSVAANGGSVQAELLAIKAKDKDLTKQDFEAKLKDSKLSPDEKKQLEELFTKADTANGGKSDGIVSESDLLKLGIKRHDFGKQIGDSSGNGGLDIPA